MKVVLLCVCVWWGGGTHVNRYDLQPKSNPEGRAILAELMSAAEDFRSTLTIILAGYRADVEESLFAFNPGMPSRFP